MPSKNDRGLATEECLNSRINLDGSASARSIISITDKIHLSRGEIVDKIRLKIFIVLGLFYAGKRVY